MYRVVLPYAVFGIVVDFQGIVLEVAPIENWMKGKTIEKITTWILSKKGTIEELEEL